MSVMLTICEVIKNLNQLSCSRQGPCSMPNQPLAVSHLPLAHPYHCYSILFSILCPPPLLIWFAPAESTTPLSCCDALYSAASAHPSALHPPILLCQCLLQTYVFNTPFPPCHFHLQPPRLPLCSRADQCRMIKMSLLKLSEGKHLRFLHRGKD